MADIRIKMSSPAVQAAILATLSRNKAVTGEVARSARQVRDEARRRAGAGAGHVIMQRHYDARTRRVEYRVGWLPRHFYMAFKELGTVHQQAQPFLRPAADMFGAKPPQDGL